MTLILTKPEYMRQMVKIETTRKTTCDITTEKIENMEPHLCIVNSLVVSEKGFRKMKEELEDIRNEYVNIKRYKCECNFCGEYDNSYCITIKKKESNYNAASYCKDCMKHLLEKGTQVIEEMRDKYFYYDTSGFVVKEYKEEEQISYIVQDEKISTKLLVEIGFCEDMMKYRLGVSNVERFAEYLKQEEKTLNQPGECLVCKEEKALFYIDKINSTLCEDCKKEMASGLEEFMQKEGDYIISRII